MVRRLLSAGYWLFAVLGLAAFAIAFCVPVTAWAGLRHKKPAADDASPGKPLASQPPEFTIPVEPLGFYAPAAFYQGERASLVSLDFLDENRLLFTFRAPGLIHRTKYAEDERQIRAVVLSLPGGLVDAEALWSLHDRGRYLWMMKDGHFLLRDRDLLKEGDASLELTPFLQFPGPVVWMEMDPTEQFLVTDSQEPAAVKPKAGEVGSPVTAQASVTTVNDENSDSPDLVLRILHRESGKVMLVSRVRSQVQLPISPDGYLETLRSSGRDWLLNLNYFTGGSKILGKIESSCQPPVEFVSRTEAVANTCAPQGGRNLVAVSTEGRRLWDAPCGATQVWPLLVMSANGSILVRETLSVSHPVEAFTPLSFDDVTGQLVEVYDAERGTLKLKASANPVLDGGGNVAISPSGKRVAVLSAGAIQVYELSAQATAGPGTVPHAP
jgi:hypothetical protein